MDNELFLQKYRDIYESLQAFSIQDNTLILNYNGVFMMNISHIKLSSLNTNLFLLSPTEIYQVLYMLELLYNDQVTNYEINFVTSYVNNYLNLNDSLLSNGENTKDLEQKTNILGIPIYTSYDEGFNDKPVSNLVKDLLNKHMNDLENGQSKGQRLVRINPNVITEETDFDYLKNAGFTALALILLGVITTTAYIFYFVINH